jgi:hypothetical protein
MSVGLDVKPGMIANSLLNIVCYEQNRLPLLSRKELAGADFKSVSSTVAGNGEIFFSPSATHGDASQIETLIVFKMYEDTKVVFPPGISLADPVNYRTEVDRILLRCDRNESSVIQSAWYHASNNLVYIGSKDYSKETTWKSHQDKSSYVLLQRMACRPKEALGCS